MAALITQADVASELKRRQKNAASIQTEVNHVCTKAESDAGPGCGGCVAALWRSVMRNGFGRLESIEKPAAAPQTAVAGATAVSTRWLGKNKAAQNKVAMASTALQQRVSKLEARASEERSKASYLAKADKPAALRALKKSKQLKAQALSAAAALEGLEQQVDMLEQAELQQVVASALEQQLKGNKGHKGLLSKAERVTDASAELKDMVDDVSQVFQDAQLAGSAHDFDDDELLAELESMANEPDDGDGGGGTAVKQKASAEERQALREELMAAEAEALNRAHEARDALRAAKPVPTDAKADAEEETARARKRLEKQRLLPS
jgi:hypothetical protein